MFVPVFECVSSIVLTMIDLLHVTFKVLYRSSNSIPIKKATLIMSNGMWDCTLLY